MAYTWIPFYKEFAQKLLQFRNDRQPLIGYIQTLMRIISSILKMLLMGGMLQTLTPLPSNTTKHNKNRPFRVFRIWII